MVEVQMLDLEVLYCSKSVDEVPSIRAIHV